MFKNNPLASFSPRKNKGGDPDYEEIGPPRRKNIDNRIIDDKMGSCTLCELCGSIEATVTCERCNGQAFCFSCDDMYHKHPKRATHTRTALLAGETGAGNKSGVRPPLPPKTGSDGPPQHCSSLLSPPQPPPRKNKRSFLSSSSSNIKKDHERNFRASTSDLFSRSLSSGNQDSGGKSFMGSLRRIMGNRPLPPTPDQDRGESKRSDFATYASGIFRSRTTPTAAKNDDLDNSQSESVALPLSILELNRKTSASVGSKTPSSMPPTTPTGSAPVTSQFPRVQPRGQTPPVRSRKLSLQQFPSPGQDKKAASVVESQLNSYPWDKNQQQLSLVSQKGRSQSISNDQWNQVIALQAGGHPSHPHMPPFNNPGAGSEFSGGNQPSSKANFHPATNGVRGSVSTSGRGMTSSTSVCDLNNIAHHPHQLPYPSNMSAANSFQQLSLLGHDNQMMWMPPCAMCQPMLPPAASQEGMKRTSSNMSMNLSSVGSEVGGYPWGHGGHMHPHMPMFAHPGYFPQGGCHQHVGPHMGMRGSALSIPDTMRNFNRMHTSPAPSSRSHRSHKSSKSRAFGTPESGRTSRNRSKKRSEESDETDSSSYSDEDPRIQVPSSKFTRTGLSWQCDHCTFINPGHVHVCGMCSKNPSKIGTRSSFSRNDKVKSNSHKNHRTRKTDPEDNMSDYDNNKRNTRKSRHDRLKSTQSLKSSRNKSNRRSSYSRSPSLSGSNEDEAVKLERQIKDLHISTRNRDYEGISFTSRNKIQPSNKKEGGSRYRNRRRFQNERSRTPARSTRSSPARPSQRTYDFDVSSEASDEDLKIEQKSSFEGTLVGTNDTNSKTLNSEKDDNYKKDDSNESLKVTASSESQSSKESSDEEDEQDNNVQNCEEKNEMKYPRILEDNFRSEKIYPIEVVDNVSEKNYGSDVENILLMLPKRRNSKELDEPPSFANTLDGIETLKTDEVADPNSQIIDDRPSSADVPAHELNDIPILKYILPKEYEDIEIKPCKPNNDSNEDSSSKKSNKYSTVKRKKDKKAETSKKIDTEDSPTYDSVAKPVVKKDEQENTEVQSKKDLRDEPLSENEQQDDIYQAVSFKNENKIADNQQISNKSSEIRTPNTKIEEYIDASSSASSNSSGRNNVKRYTPLSYSSSDAQFYSPADSPENSLSDKLNMNTKQNSNSTTQLAIEDDLVTALEFIGSSREDLLSSRETIRSSFDQLNMDSDEIFESDHQVSNTAVEKKGQIPLVEVILPPSSPTSVDDSNVAYDTLSFRDALSAQPSEVNSLKRSRSEGVLSSGSGRETKQGNDDVPLNPTLQEKKALETKRYQIKDDDQSNLSVREIINRRKMKQGLELVQILRDAENLGFNPEDVSVALTLAKEENEDPIKWLQKNWKQMIETVVTLSSTYGRERKYNDVGEITPAEAKTALRLEKGNIWYAVATCVETRRKNFNEIYSKGTFKKEEINKMLSIHEGDPEIALMQLSKSRQIGSFFKKIWAPAEEAMNSVSSLFKRETKLSDKPPAVMPRKILIPRPGANIEKLPMPEMHEMMYVNLSEAAKEKQELLESKLNSKVVAPLLKKIEQTFLENSSDGKFPEISEELKQKIIKTILEAEPESITESFNFDIEDDLDEEEDEKSERRAVAEDEESGNESSFAKSSGTISENDPEDQILESEEVPSEFEFKKNFKTEPNLLHQLSEEKEVEEILSSEDEDEIVVVITLPKPHQKLHQSNATKEITAITSTSTNIIPSDVAVDQLDPEEAAKVRASGGPVTVQKASAIVGKAISNAMMRESTVKKDNYPPPNSATFSSSVSYISTPPLSDSEEGLEDETEENQEVEPSIVTSESEDDLLGSLDTIPEEEEFSERTESGRLMARSAKSESASKSVSQKESTSSEASIPPAVASYAGPIFIPSNEKAALPKASLLKNNLKQSASISDSSSDTSNSQPSKVVIEKKISSPTLTKKSSPNISSPKSINKSTPQKQLSTTSNSSAGSASSSINSKTPSPPVTTGVKPPSSTALPSGRKLKLGERSIIDSSGESEEEEEKLSPAAAAQMVEDLKQSDDPDYQEVQELKEQIKMMRRELEGQISLEEDETDYGSDTTAATGQSTPQEEEEVPQQPVFVVSSPSEDEQKKPETKRILLSSVLPPPRKLDKEEYEKLKFDRTVRRLLAEGHAKTYEKAEMAAQLVNLSFDESDSCQAADGCSSLYTALNFLQQDCELCAGKYPVARMVSMLHCIHRCCYECANNYFSFQIKTKNVRELRCPFCNEPDLDNAEEITGEYLNNLEILLKNIVDKDTHELLQRKVRDWTLMKDPNFKWCNKCSSGFISNPRARKLYCPDCKDVTCAHCRKTWEPQHEGISCDDYSKWQEENNPETQAEGVAKHLAENGITCPKCRFTYSLAKGGCMHFTCGECKYEFCSGCSKPFKQGAKCSVGPYCEKLGLHAHHPRNCLFYLRDKEPAELQQLLKESDIDFKSDNPTESNSPAPKNTCTVMEQKETLDGLKDDICGRVTISGHAGYCRIHYIEYLVDIINIKGLDPVNIFDEADLRVCLRRNGKNVPVRRWESEKLYRNKLIKLIKEQLPLNIK